MAKKKEKPMKNDKEMLKEKYEKKKGKMKKDCPCK